MMLEALAPRVQDHQPADVGAESLRIRRDVAEGLRGGLKQEVVHHALVGERDACERLRHREDDVDVPDGQQLLLRGPPPRRSAPR